LALVTSISDVSYPGDVLWFLSGVSWGAFMVVMRRWTLDAVLVTAVASVLSLAYLPVYVTLLSPTLSQAGAGQVIFQLANQE